jgi:hypothetical protein
VREEDGIALRAHLHELAEGLQAAAMLAEVLRREAGKNTDPALVEKVVQQLARAQLSYRQLRNEIEDILLTPFATGRADPETALHEKSRSRRTAGHEADEATPTSEIGSTRPDDWDHVSRVGR